MPPFSNFPLVTGIKDKVEAILAIGKGFVILSLALHSLY